MASERVPKLFTRQSSGLVREVSVANALFFNTSAFMEGHVDTTFIERTFMSGDHR